MSYPNLSDSGNKENINDTDVVVINDETSSTKENHTSQHFQDYEINDELEELRNKIRSEIEKREQSNLKHNILYIPTLEASTKEEISKELKLLKEKITTVTNSRLFFNNIHDSKYEIRDGNKMPIVLKSLLENKLSITKEIQKLTCVEDILKCKIKFRENLDSIAFDLNANHKDFDDNNILFYRQQWRKVVTELNELKNLQTSLDLKIKSLMLDTNISPNSNDFLKHVIELKTCQCEFQVKHINHIKEVFREEINVKDKFIHIMAQMLDMYNSVLRRNSLLTKQMSDSYCNMIRTAQGLGINTLLAENEPHISNVKSQDSGISDTNT